VRAVTAVDRVRASLLRIAAPLAVAAGRARRPLPAFVALLLTLSLPFWLVGATGRELLPRLPVSALMAVCPLIAAAILAYRAGGARGVRALLRRYALAAAVVAARWGPGALAHSSR